MAIVKRTKLTYYNLIGQLNKILTDQAQEISDLKDRVAVLEA